MSDQPSTIDPILRDQALGSAVQYHIRYVIQAAARTVQLLEPRTKNDGSGMLNNQMSNVVNVSISAGSVEEIAAFILYQMGRCKEDQQWRYQRDKKVFGDEVVKDLMSRSVRLNADAALEQALEMIKLGGGTLSKAEKKKLHNEAYILLTRQYLGYLGRLFYFAHRAEGWKRLADLVKEEGDQA